MDSQVEKTEWTIGELSREFGITLRTLRFYENKGLLSPQNTGTKTFAHRVYSQVDRDRLELILKGKKFRFTLSEISGILNKAGADAARLKLTREQCLEQTALLQRQKEEIEDALKELDRIFCALEDT